MLVRRVAVSKLKRGLPARSLRRASVGLYTGVQFAGPS